MRVMSLLRGWKTLISVGQGLGKILISGIIISIDYMMEMEWRDLEGVSR